MVKNIVTIPQWLYQWGVLSLIGTLVAILWSIHIGMTEARLDFSVHVAAEEERNRSVVYRLTTLERYQRNRFPNNRFIPHKDLLDSKKNKATF